MEVGKNMIYEKNNTIIDWLNNGKGTWPANQKIRYSDDAVVSIAGFNLEMAGFSSKTSKQAGNSG